MRRVFNLNNDYSSLQEGNGVLREERHRIVKYIIMKYKLKKNNSNDSFYVVNLGIC